MLSRWYENPTYDGAPPHVQKVLDSIIPEREVESDLWYHLIDDVVPGLRRGSSAVLREHTDYPWEQLTDDMVIVVLLAAKKGFGIKNPRFVEMFTDTVFTLSEHGRKFGWDLGKVLKSTLIEGLKQKADIAEDYLVTLLAVKGDQNNDKQLLEAVSNANTLEKHSYINVTYRFNYDSTTGQPNAIINSFLKNRGFSLIDQRIKLLYMYGGSGELDLLRGRFLGLYRSSDGRLLMVNQVKGKDNGPGKIKICLEVKNGQIVWEELDVLNHLDKQPKQQTSPRDFQEAFLKLALRGWRTPKKTPFVLKVLSKYYAYERPHQIPNVESITKELRVLKIKHTPIKATYTWSQMNYKY